jgi:hypothetical protein
LVRGSSMFWGVRQAEKGEVATMSICLFAGWMTDLLRCCCYGCRCIFIY